MGDQSRAISARDVGDSPQGKAGWEHAGEKIPPRWAERVVVVRSGLEPPTLRFQSTAVLGRPRGTVAQQRSRFGLGGRWR